MPLKALITFRLFSVVASATLSLVVSQPAHAAFMTGQTLLGLCSSQKPDNLFACDNYIAGVVDYQNWLRSMGTTTGLDICLPKTVKMQQLTQIVREHLKQHTEQHSFIAAPAVTLALYGVYPCNIKK